MHRQLKKRDPVVVNLYNQYRKTDFTIQDLIEFIGIYNRLPRTFKSEIGLYNWMRKQLHAGNQEVIDIYNRFNPDKPWKG